MQLISNKFAVGQVLYYIKYAHNRNSVPEGFPITITKVGNRWLSTDNHWIRIDKNTLQADGGKYSSPGKAWLSEEEYITHYTRNKLWMEIFRSVRANDMPSKITVSELETILNLLRKNDE
jgi:hypothetical protein